MIKEIKIENAKVARFSFRVPLVTRLRAEKLAEKNRESISDVLRGIVSNELMQKNAE